MFNTNTENQAILCWGSNVHMYFTYAVDTDDYNTLFKMIFIYDILKQPSRMKQQ